MANINKTSYEVEMALLKKAMEDVSRDVKEIKIHVSKWTVEHALIDSEIKECAKQREESKNKVRALEKKVDRLNWIWGAIVVAFGFIVNFVPDIFKKLFLGG